VDELHCRIEKSLERDLKLDEKCGDGRREVTFQNITRSFLLTGRNTLDGHCERVLASHRIEHTLGHVTVVNCTNGILVEEFS